MPLVYVFKAEGDYAYHYITLHRHVACPNEQEEGTCSKLVFRGQYTLSLYKKPLRIRRSRIETAI